MRNTMWDRLRERFLAARRPDGQPVMTDADSWDLVIHASAYEGMTTGGPMAKFWERNCWKPVFAAQIGTTCPAPDPAPSGYLYPPLAKRARTEDVRAPAAPPPAPAVDASRTETLDASAKPKKCANCGQSGHQWWDGCPLVLREDLATNLANKGRSKGGPDRKTGPGPRRGGTPDWAAKKKEEKKKRDDGRGSGRSNRR